ncbi:LacI family DNA-binding transcriptional regulator [Rahnella bonaserana]|jgi:LacI family transcriptional regulator of maltose regulon|uniref:LacI family DNA-binding transcriptional regulator n=1 Tax=Rahnella bonaserana TaxID=2816248 RepID=A0ABS6LRH0_9GAMM|nr:LacI family DNA-binding transcriptional regulator [Rahnella bonaserana]MBU9854713.1 LacI family DNA-binding transcriptional regulator [Rahnella bonaserana]MCL9645230.1 LacI family DNA-binding transcriptional regulator [Rahnella victoriana]WHZ40589.1 LacI family DNA-binding transcriptional regulator [Rahnella bonaserana]
MANGKTMTAKKPRNKITQQDVARVAGVSVAAVSLVLGGKGRISPQGVERIYQAIDQLGYRRATISPSVMLPRIGVLLPYDCAFSAALLPELSKVLQQAGFAVALSYSTQSPSEVLAQTEALLAQDARGIIVCGKLLNIPPETLQALNARTTARHVALTGICAHHHPGPVAAVQPDNALAAHMAADALLEQQHHHIAYLGGENHSLIRAERLGGLSVALGKAGRAFSPSLSFPCAATFDDASLAVVQVFKHNPKVSAILCDNPTVLQAVHHALLNRLQANKWRLFSRRIALTGFGECQQSLKLQLPLIAVTQNAIAIRTLECLQRQTDEGSLLPGDPRLTLTPVFL